MILSLTFRFLEQKLTVLPYWCVNVPNICMNRIIRRYDAGNYIFHKICKTTLVWSLGTTMSDCCIVVWYDSLKNAIIIEKKSESNSLLFLFVVRGHSTTTWTEFWHFLTPLPLPCVDCFYALSVDKKKDIFWPPRSHWMAPKYSSSSLVGGFLLKNVSDILWIPLSC